MFILFGACYATRLCALNRVTVQFINASKKTTDFFLFVSDMIWLVFSLVMAYEGYVAVMDLREFPYATPALDWDLGMVYLVFPLSFLLMAIRIVQVNYIRFILKEEIADPDQEAIKESQSALLNEDSQTGRFLQFHFSFSRLLWLFEAVCISIQIVKLFFLAL